MTQIAFSIDITLADETALCELCPGAPARGLTGDFLPYAILNARSSDNGIVLLPGTRAQKRAGTKEWTLFVAVEVVDEVRLVAEAIERRAACWGEPDWVPATLCEAVYEVLAASNDNPSPDEAGYAFGRKEYLIDSEISKDTVRCS